LIDLSSWEGMSYEEIVARTQHEIDRAVVEPTVVVNLKERKLTLSVKGRAIEVPLSPKEIALYTHHARNLLDGHPWETVPELLERESEIRAHYEQTRPSAEAFKIDKDILRQLQAKINRKIKDAVKDDFIARYCRIEAKGPRAATTYGLRLDRSKVTVVYE